MRTLWAIVAGTCLLLPSFGCGPGEGTPEPIALEGRWVGELESGLLLSGSSVVSLDVTRATADSEPTAVVIFGTGAAPTPPTDADVGWPPGLDPLEGDIVPVADGFVYRVSTGSRMDNRVRFDIPVTELWEPWCAIQVPFRTLPGSDEAQCLPNRPWTATPFECQLDEAGGEPVMMVECLKLTLCRRSRVCDCDVTGGCAPSVDGITMYLDVNFTDEEGVGTIVWMGEGMVSGSARVRFTRE